MKTIPNFFLFLIFVGVACTSTKVEEAPPEYDRHVGDIAFDPQWDDPAFNPCHEDLATQYYGFGEGILYEGEKAALVKQCREGYKRGKMGGEDGYIIVRFMVNCEGKTGRFRMEELDKNYEEKSFTRALSKQILDMVKALDGWKPGEYNENTYDYYQLLTFKIVDSDISEIIP